MADPALPPRGPLAGVRILDLTRVLAGPYCTTLLWELGAEVLKVEQPGHGDDTRAFPPFVNGESVYFASINRGKRSIALNLRDAEDKATFDALLARADVLVENFQPGAMERLGYGWETVHARHRALVYAAISGFGQTGPYRNLPAYDLVVQALGGMVSINGPEGGGGMRLGISLADLGAGLFAALGVVSALYDRKTSGVGRLVDIAMLDCQTMLLESALVRQLATGETQRPTGSRHPVITPFDIFQTSDAPIAIACANEHLFAALAGAIGRPDLTANANYSSLYARFTNQAALKVEIEKALAGKSAAEWVRTLQAADVPCAPVQDMTAVVRDPQLAARGMIVEVDDPEMGKLRMGGNAIKISGYPDSPTRPPAPNLDEARAYVLEELGIEPAPQRERIREGPKDPAW